MKTRFLIIIAATILLVMSGCSNERTIVIGGLLPLSGNAATFGQSSKQGMQLAVDQTNAKGGIVIDNKTCSVVPIFEDDKGQP